MAYQRTNRTGSVVAFTVTGSSTVAVHFGRTYEANLDDLTAVPGQFSYRIYPNSSQLATPTWRVRSASGRVLLDHMLDPSELYVVEIRVLRVGSAVDAIRAVPSNLERWREPEEGLDSIEDDVEGGFGPCAQFFEIENIEVNSGGVVGSVTWTAIPTALNVLVLGDGMIDGIVIGDQGESDDLGVLHSYVRLGLERTVAELNPSRRLNTMNLAFDRAHFSHLRFPLETQSGVIVQSLDDFKAGVGTRISDGAVIQLDMRQDYPGYTQQLHSQFTVARAHAFAPDMVVIALGLFDQMVQDPSDLTWQTTAASDFLALITNLRSTYSDPPILVVTPHTEGLENAAHQDTVVQAMIDGVAAAITGGVPSSELTIMSLAEVRDSLLEE